MHALVLAALVWMPRFDAGAEVAYEVGLDEGLRATIELSIEVVPVAGDDWQLILFHDAQSYVRSNDRRYETLFRISPQQIHYPVGARLRFELSDGHAWGLVAFHQSNHDIDSFDERFARETLAYELYGAEWLSPWVHLWGGFLYDRGTRLDGTRQGLPLNYYVAGLIAESELPLTEVLYVGGRARLFGHLNGDHAPPHLNVDGRLDFGAALRGEGGVWRFFARIQRIEDYQHLDDRPRHLILLGTRLSTR